MGLYTPADYLQAPLAATVASGETAAVTLGPSLTFIRIQRVATSAGVLQFVLAAGTVATPYELTADDPDTGWMPCSDRTASIKASAGDVDYRIWRIGHPA